MRTPTPLIAEAQLLLRATSGNNCYTNQVALSLMRDKLYAEMAREKLVTKGFVGGLAAVVGQAVLPGIGLLLGPAAISWSSKATNDLFNNTYLPLIRQFDARLTIKEVR